MGGATRNEYCFVYLVTGLSPRGRGNRILESRADCPKGSIPAWAGQPGLSSGSPASPRVYPRVGGATDPCNPMIQNRLGLSPRGRGNPLSYFPRQVELRSIPAWAGQPNGQHGRRNDGTVYPRVGGATNRLPQFQSLCYGLSPRGRGNPGGDDDRRTAWRSIPAWAGQPPSQSRQ